MGDPVNKRDRQGRGGDSTGRGSGKAGNVEYTRVVPKFLRHLVNSEANHYDTFKPLPSSSRTAKEREERLKAGGVPTASELEELRREGFLVDAIADSPEKATLAGAENVAQSTTEVSRSSKSDVLNPLPGKISALPPRHAQKSTLKVAAHTISKNLNGRKARPEFATKNRSKLSFSVASDEDSSDEES